MIAIFGCENDDSNSENIYPLQPYVIVLGIAQDAGFPQANCDKECCERAWQDKALRQMVSCIGIVDPTTNQCWMIDATPDFKDQLSLLQKHRNEKLRLEGIALTHAHIGHYTGLMNLGREVMGAQNIPVYAMPRMTSFLSNNGPWSQLVDLQNIKLIQIKHDSTLNLNENISLTPFLVPHRDEFSETVGYEISGGENSLIFIPDIDKWSKWNKDLQSVIESHDYSLIDGSFYANGELPGRDMSEIPHPFVVETIEQLADLTNSEKEKVHFIHFNHTNPLLDMSSQQYREVLDMGFGICRSGQSFAL